MIEKCFPCKGRGLLGNILCVYCGGTGNGDYKRCERERALAIDPLLDFDVDNAK